MPTSAATPTTISPALPPDRLLCPFPGAGRADAPVSRISGIVKGERAITADTALRLARFFGTSAEMWLGLQADYDLRVARRASGHNIDKRVRPLAA